MLLQNKKKCEDPDFIVDDKVIEVGGTYKKSTNADYVIVDGLEYQEMHLFYSYLICCIEKRMVLSIFSKNSQML
ncbi:MAG: hypothetical protein ACP5LH_00890 [Candidatus Micrarchaeia archaeon]